MAVGIDCSLASVSLGGISKTHGKIRAKATAKRWRKDVDYFTRLRDVSKSHDLIHDLLAELRVMPELDQIFIAIEEPVAMGHMQRNQGNSIKQQIEINGALLGGLLRWGFPHIYQIQANQWRKVVADDLGITTHHTKWNPNGEGKFRAKEWVKKFHPKWDGQWDDLIRSSKHGLIPRPEKSIAKAEQSDDRYEALAMAQWARLNLAK